MNKSFIKLHEEIIQLKSELHKRSYEYLASKEHYVEPKTVDKSVNDVLINVINKVSKRNISRIGYQCLIKLQNFYIIYPLANKAYIIF